MLSFIHTDAARLLAAVVIVVCAVCAQVAICQAHDAAHPRADAAFMDDV
jgi:hypothetical protein